MPWHSRSLLGYFLLTAFVLSGCTATLPAGQPQPASVQATPFPIPVLADLTDLFPSSVASYTTPYPFTIRTEAIATLNVPSGEIIASDLYFGSLTRPLVRRVPPGRYPVSLSLIRENGQAWESVAAAKIQFASTRPLSWELALIPEQNLSSLKPGEIFGYAVDSATGSFASPASAQALASKLDNDRAYGDQISKRARFTVPPAPGRRSYLIQQLIAILCCSHQVMATGSMPPTGGLISRGSRFV